MGTTAKTAAWPRRTTTPGNRAGVFAYALDADTARALWARPEELVGESFPD